MQVDEPKKLGFSTQFHKSRKLLPKNTTHDKIYSPVKFYDHMIYTSNDTSKTVLYLVFQSLL